MTSTTRSCSRVVQASSALRLGLRFHEVGHPIVAGDRDREPEEVEPCGELTGFTSPPRRPRNFSTTAPASLRRPHPSPLLSVSQHHQPARGVNTASRRPCACLPMHPEIRTACKSINNRLMRIRATQSNVQEQRRVGPLRNSAQLRPCVSQTRMVSEIVPNPIRGITWP
jgi:hypothetical protein